MDRGFGVRLKEGEEDGLLMGDCWDGCYKDGCYTGCYRDDLSGWIVDWVVCLLLMFLLFIGFWYLIEKASLRKTRANIINNIPKNSHHYIYKKTIPYIPHNNI